jgi:hypothetical protein
VFEAFYNRRFTIKNQTTVIRFQQVGVIMKVFISTKDSVSVWFVNRIKNVTAVSSFQLPEFPAADRSKVNQTQNNNHVGLITAFIAGVVTATIHVICEVNHIADIDVGVTINIAQTKRIWRRTALPQISTQVVHV